MSFESFYQAGAGLFGAYGKGQEEFRQRNALAQLGTQLQGGDYNGAAQTAFAAGDAQTGIGLLKLGEAQRQSKLEEANVATFFGGGSGALAALGADQSSGLSPLGAPSRSLPSFADTSGPAGGYLAGLEKRESGGNALARNSSSSATGLHQFTDRTWAGVMREHPELGLTPNGRTDPEQSRRAVVAFTADNERVLQRAGLPVNDASRYASHFLGRSGGPRFVAGALNNPDAPASAYANPDQVRANRTIFYNRDGSPKTAGQVMADFGRSFGGVQRPAGAPSRAGVVVANNEAETQALEARMGMVPPVRRPVAFASNEAETQVLEARMGMTPQVPQQVASYDPRADMPAQGAIPMGFSIPEGQGAVGDEQPAGPRRAVASSSSIFNGDATRIANPSFGAPAMGAPPPGRTMSLPQEAGGPPAQVAQAGGGLPAGVAPQQAPAGGDMGLMARLSRMSPNERVDYLTRLSAVRLPERFQGIIKSQLDAALQEARDPEGVREFVWARRNGMTQARSPAEYAREQKGPQGYAPGTSILTPDGQSVAFTVPDRNRSNVADDIDARRQAAAGLGLREGTPQFQSYVLTGKMPREDQQAPSPSDRKAILEADETVESANAAITNLKAAKELSAKAYAGPLAGWRGWAMGALGSETGQATQELDNLVTTNALSQLKAIFGAAPTEGERKILLDIQGSSSLPHALRIKIYDRAEKAIERRRQIFQERADGIRGGTYFRPDGGPQGSRGASSTGGAPALPAPAPSNRPGAASAGDRFGALVGSGMSREQAFEQMAQEGY